MNYSEQETAYIQRQIRRLKKWHKNWPVLRWAMLLVAGISLADAVFTFHTILKLQETSSVFTLPKKEYNAEQISIFMEGNLLDLQTKIYFFMRSVLKALLGIGFLIYSLSNWNRHIRDGITIKSLQNQIDEKSKQI